MRCRKVLAVERCLVCRAGCGPVARAERLPTVGEQVGKNLYVKVQQGIGSESQTNIILEYELTKWLRLRTNMLQGAATQALMFQRMQGSGADLLFFFSY